ncbi:MAG: PQQ-binding-like beta-propeller repeat protein [Bacteroidetes bacterium]|nr:PQQ-binding-like beta-propeller repeat protein [Bacteroidota bacterium]
MKTLLKITLLFLTLLLHAQEDIKLRGRVLAKVVNDQTGTLMVATSKATYGISASTHGLLWKQKKLRKVDFSSYTEIANTSYVVFETKQLINSKLLSGALNTQGASVILMDINTGDILFDSKKAGYKSVNKTLIMPDNKSILVNGVKNRQLTLGKFECQSGKPIWETPLDKNSFLDAVKRNLLGKEKVFLDTDGNILWFNYGQFVKINSHSGEILYEVKNLSNIEYEKQKNILFVFSNKLKATKLTQETAVYASDATTLQPVWKDTLRIYGNITSTAIDKDKLIAITTKGFDVIDIDSGHRRWEKTETLPLIKRIVPVETGYLVAQEQYLILIDDTGQKKWDNEVKISKTDDHGIIFLEEEKGQILSITPSFIHKVDAQTGADIWNEPLVLNSATYLDRSLKISQNRYQVWQDKPADNYLVFSNNMMYAVKPTDTLEAKLLHSFDSNQIPNVEIREDGYFVFQKNNFHFFEKNGIMKYEKKYASTKNATFFGKTKDFGERGFDTYKATLLFIPNQINNTFKSVLVSTNLGFVTSTSGFIYGNYQSYMGIYDNLTDVNRIAVGSNLEGMLRRTEKGKKNDSSLILVIPEDTQLRILELFKDSGEEKHLKTIATDSKDFVIDQVEKILYLFEKNKMVVFPLD